MTAAETVQAATERAGRLPILRPRTVLLLAVAVAALSLVTVLLGGAAVAVVLLAAAGVVVTVLATVTAVRRDSVFVAPVAIALVALCSPLLLLGTAAQVEAKAGVFTVELDRGLVLWRNYPGIAGWQAPKDVATTDVAALAQDVQRAERTVVARMTDAYGWTWTIGERDAGVFGIANGYGGVSDFARVDSPEWQSASFDGSSAQRDDLIAATDAAAATLSLTTVADPSGDVATGDGVRTWTDGTGGTLSLRVDGADVTLSYVGGPFLQGTRAEYDLHMLGFEDVIPPAPIVVPDLP